ncbi:MAG: DUF6398 domain-containing protein [Candidatus Latescibacterota bacterium]
MTHSSDEKKERLQEIKSIVHSFCEERLDEELEGYALKLCDAIGRKRKINILRGKKEVWAASAVYAIARLNFLFDQKSDHYISVEDICNFFDSKKSTIANKATQIGNICKLTLGAEGYCNQEITDMLTFCKTPEGFLLPKRMIRRREIVVEFVGGEEAEELNQFAENQRKMSEQKIKERKERRAEINRKIAENKKKKKGDSQLELF